MWNGVDRRKGNDWLASAINLLNIVSWTVFIIALVLFHYAKPEMATYATEVRGISVRQHWIMSLREWLVLSLYVCAGNSLVTLAFNSFRIKRKTDRKRYNLILLIVVTGAFAGVVLS